MTDDAALADLLRRAGLSDDLAALDDLLAGIAAAPPAYDPDAWLELIGTRPARRAAGSPARPARRAGRPTGSGARPRRAAAHGCAPPCASAGWTGSC